MTLNTINYHFFTVCSNHVTNELQNPVAVTIISRPEELK